jgi:hypothetical protein
MKYRSSTETSLLIIATLLENKEYAQYDMPQIVEKDYRTILRHLKKLEYHGLIKVVRTEPAAKKGKERKIFSLELNGLIIGLKFLFSIIKNPIQLAEDMEKLAIIHKELLPLILGKWEFWKKEKIEELILNQLKKALDRIEYPYFFVRSTPIPYKGEIHTEKNLLKTAKKLFGSTKYVKDFEIFSESLQDFRKASDEFTQYIFYKKVLLEGWDNKFEKISIFFKKENLEGFVEWNEKFKNFLKSLVKDSDLSNFIDDYFINMREEYEYYLKNIDDWNNLWTSLKTGNKKMVN